MRRRFPARSSLLLSITLAFGIVACADHPHAPVDKQLRVGFTFHYSGVVATEGRWIVPVEMMSLSHFDKRNYPDVDSIVISALMWNQYPGGTTSLSLYNHTDTIQIRGTEISFSSTSPAWVTSGNIYDMLPEKEITLGGVLEGTGIEGWGHVTDVILLLYRD